MLLTQLPYQIALIPELNGQTVQRSEKLGTKDRADHAGYVKSSFLLIVF